MSKLLQSTMYMLHNETVLGFPDVTSHVTIIVRLDQYFISFLENVELP